MPPGREVARAVGGSGARLMTLLYGLKYRHGTPGADDHQGDHDEFAPIPMAPMHCWRQNWEDMS